jgi:hypothetical protein
MEGGFETRVGMLSVDWARQNGLDVLGEGLTDPGDLRLRDAADAEGLGEIVDFARGHALDLDDDGLGAPARHAFLGPSCEGK